MDKKLAEVVVEACECVGIEANVREGYSGRGMHGKTTTAVVLDGDLGNVLGAVIANADLFVDFDETEALFQDQGSFRQDSIGLGTIIY